MTEAAEYAWNFEHEMPQVRPRSNQVSVSPEPPHPLVTALEGLIARLRWHLDALREWIKRLGMAQKMDEYDPREPPDVERHPFHNKDLAEFVRLAAKLGRSVNNVSGGGGGPKEHWIDYVLKGLVILGIAALVGVTFSVRDKVTRIDTYLAEKDKENEREFARIYKALDGHDQRLDGLEYQRRNAEPHAHRR
jgi:hypothetical protein